MFCLFDSITEGIITLFVFNHTLFVFNHNAAIYPRLLVWVGFNSHSGNNIPYTFPDELSHRVRVYVNVIVRGYPEHIPDQNNLETWIPIGQTSVE
jgi:hypothetical protein